ncbi:hypothetical protein QQ045_031098 [Rhodiola kirilowii]
MVRIVSASPELCSAVSRMKFGASGPKWTQKSCGFMVLIGSWRRSRMRVLSASMSEDSAPEVRLKTGFNHSEEIFGLENDLQPRFEAQNVPNPRSWFGPNGQYIRELPCPSCRGRGYTPCTECGIERSRVDCSLCSGKGLMTCLQCLGDCVVWEESIDEQPWEKARSISPLKVKEDDEVDKLDIKLVKRKSKRVYQSPPPEVSRKISRSLKSLNAKTGLFSKRMKIIHLDAALHAQRVAAIKKTKGTAEARKRASESMKTFFSNPENRRKRSISMRGVSYSCSNCGKQGHRRYHCPELQGATIGWRFTCSVCGEKGHNRRTCSTAKSSESKSKTPVHHHCKMCGQSGHNRRTCSFVDEAGLSGTIRSGGLVVSGKRIYTCGLCMKDGHNRRTCPTKDHFPNEE